MPTSSDMMTTMLGFAFCAWADRPTPSIAVETVITARPHLIRLIRFIVLLCSFLFCSGVSICSGQNSFFNAGRRNGSQSHFMMAESGFLHRNGDGVGGAKYHEITHLVISQL